MILGILQAKSELKRSAVADNVSGKSKLSQVRTSSGMFISKAKVVCSFFDFALLIGLDASLVLLLEEIGCAIVARFSYG